jgi:amino acid transporter
MTEKRTTVFAREATGLVRAISPTQALFWNLNTMGVLLILVYTTWAAGLYPNADLPSTVILAIPLSIPIALLYAFFSAAMPRAGGDYVWVSRVLHPALGFMSTFLVCSVLFSWIGSAPAWAMQYGVASVLQGIGILNHDQSLMSLAQVVSSTSFNLVFGLVYLIAIGLLMARGPRAIGRLMMITAVFILLGTIAYVATVYFGGFATFQQRFDTMSGSTVAAVINAAQAQGYARTVTFTASVLGAVYTFLNLWGYFATAYFAGELKNVRKTQLTSIVGSTIIFGVILWAVYAVTYYGFSREFISSISYLFTIGSADYKLPFIGPYPQFLLPYITSNPVPIVLVGFGYAATILMAGASDIWIMSRTVFAWSFDRVTPTRFASVDERFHSPYYTIALGIGLGMVALVIWLYTTWMSFMAYAITGMFMASAITGIAGMFFPYRKKDIFESAPGFVKAKIVGVPVMTILGALTFLVSVVIGYATLTPAFVGTLNPAYLGAIILVCVIALGIYLVSSVYHEKQGVPLKLSFQQIPPE